MNLSGKLGSRPSTSAPSAPPRPASPEPTAKVTQKMRLTSMPEAAGDARVVDRGAQPAAEARARQHPLQRDRERRADDDDEQPVLADADPGQVEAALQPRRQLDDLLLRADQVVDRGDRHEDEADREQHLVEVRPGVHRPVQRALEHRADRADADEGERQARTGRARRAGPSAAR